MDRREPTSATSSVAAIVSRCSPSRARRVRSRAPSLPREDQVMTPTWLIPSSPRPSDHRRAGDRSAAKVALLEGSSAVIQTRRRCPKGRCCGAPGWTGLLHCAALRLGPWPSSWSEPGGVFSALLFGWMRERSGSVIGRPRPRLRQPPSKHSTPFFSLTWTNCAAASRAGSWLRHASCGSGAFEPVAGAATHPVSTDRRRSIAM
jgi:hypothetical protein